ncbi:MAG: glycosyl transferase family 1, partial [Gemmatimonadetes bacterium]|nr:glycosyl transferase family 1 [Gemmatimonadota bacterium]
MSERAMSADEAEEARLRRVASFPATVLGLVERGGAGDSVAYVGALLERTLRELAPSARTITLFPEGGTEPTLLRRVLFSARLIAAERGADCAVFNHVGVATAQAHVPRSMRRPYTVFLHGAEAWDAAMSPGRLRALHEAAVTIANSEHTVARVRERHPELAAPLVCPLALLPEQPAGAGRVDGALVSSVMARTIVIAARMTAEERYKGHDELLDAWPVVLARRPDARLAIVGDGDDRKRLEAKAVGLGLSGSVRFTGFVSDPTLDAML